jgi:DNA-binding MarR family transcriptional regulator
MALHGLALRARSRPLTGYIAAAQYMRSLKPAERERAQALWEGKAKLTEAQILKIRADASIKTQSSLAKEFGVSAAQISGIIKRKYWKHI